MKLFPVVFIATISGTWIQKSCSTGSESPQVPSAPSGSCSWEGHCLGATCNTWDDCSDDLTCVNKKCAKPESETPSEPIETPSGPQETPSPSETPSETPSGSIKITSGNSATLTVFDDNTTQCYGQNIPSGNGCAVNPKLLGFTEFDWSSMYSNASPGDIPWCGKKMTVTVNNKSFTCTIIDTCDPVGNPFNSNGQIVGGKCDYSNVIDLYTGGNSKGLEYIQGINGDDFYQGPVKWSLA
jgi:hypothetical protein